MLSLVIMAAGMGVRFGGNKSTCPVGVNGEIIADYAIYDAIQMGFSKVIFVIRRENQQIFEDIVGKYRNQIEVKLVWQEFDVVPENFKVKPGRMKSLGTAHALYCAKNEVTDNFVVINADDFYGREAFKLAKQFFLTNKEEFATITYPWYETISELGSVKRGIIQERNGYVEEILECEINDEEAKSLDGRYIVELTKNSRVSVNFWILNQKVWPFLENEFKLFLNSDYDEQEEFLLPMMINKGIKEDVFKVKNIECNGTWMGVTYREDLPKFQEKLNVLIKRGEYPNGLFDR